MYAGGILLIMLVGAVLFWIVTLCSPDKNDDPTRAKWVAEKRKSSALEIGSAFGFNAGILGLVVGFFQSCSVERGSVDGGTWLLTVVVFAGIGAIIGGFLGYVFGD